MNRLAEIVEDWKYLIQRDGAMSALPAVGLEFAQLPYRHLRFLIVARSLTDPIPDIRPKIALEIRPFEQADLEQVKIINRPSEANYCAQRMACGHKGLVALHQDQFAGYAWGCIEVNPQLDRIYIKLELGDVLCMDVYTAPAFRGKGIQTALTLARFRMFRDIGYKRAICSILRDNAPSLAVWQRKLGSQTIGQADYLRIGPWHRVRCS